MEGLRVSNEHKYLIDNNSIYEDKSTGYFQIYFNKKAYYLHRFIMQATPGQIVDHINRDKKDNRINNLRFVTKSENNYNSGNRRRSNFGRGISFDKFGNRFRACISHNNKTLKLGSFSNTRGAKIAYNKKAKEIYGDMAFQHDI